MKELSHKEHTTAIFVIALYYWFNGDTLNARNALALAAHVARSPHRTA